MAGLKEVGKMLCDLCKQGKFEEAMESLYSEDAVQVEGAECPGVPREIKGLPALRKASEEFMKNTTVHSCSIGKPQFFEPDRFACTMTMDATHHAGPMKGRHQMEEICVYTVKNGKITRAEFFYDMPDMG